MNTRNVIEALELFAWLMKKDDVCKLIAPTVQSVLEDSPRFNHCKGRKLFLCEVINTDVPKDLVPAFKTFLTRRESYEDLQKVINYLKTLDLIGVGDE